MSESLQPQVRKRPWLPFVVVGAVVLVVGVVLSVLSSPENRPPAAQETFTLVGQIVVPARVGTFVPDDGCIGAAGFSDIKPGAGVTVYDAAGTVLAAAELTAGRMDSTRCAYSFAVPDVPRGEGYYQVEVAGRGKVTVDEVTATTSGASLTLG